MIELDKVTVTFDNGTDVIKACDEVSFKVNKGEIFGIIGLSGAGKSTLVRCINRLEDPDSGSIKIEGKDVLTMSEEELLEERKSMSMIFQSFNLFNQKTVYKNISYPLEISGYPKDKIKARVEELLNFVDLTAKKDEYPSKLSGGQKQRVAIARALAVNPKILLSDESTSALDPANTKVILDLLKKAVKEFNLTIILITHQMEVCRDICDRIAVMEKGRIVEENTAEDLFTNPKHPVTKSFIRGEDFNLTEIVEDTVEEDVKDHVSRLMTLNFKGQIAKKPIVSEVIKKTGVDVNILSGKINKLSNKSTGYLTVELTGSKDTLDKAEAMFKNEGVIVEEKQ